MRILILFISLHVFAFGKSEYQSPKRSATISTAYAERLVNSNEGLVDFPLTVIDGYGAFFDWATSSINRHWGSRLAIALVELPTLSFWLGNSLFYAYHEFGHARANSAFGRPFNYGSTFLGKDIEGIPNYWLLSGVRFFTPPIFFPGSGEAWTHSPYRKSIQNRALGQHWGKGSKRIIRAEAGLNNHSYLAKRLADRIYKDHGHITQFFHQVGNKLAGAGYCLAARNERPNYERSDVGVLQKFYQEKSLNITKKDMSFQSYLSVLSGTTFAFLRGYYNYVVHGDARVDPAELYGIRIPDINSYLNARGLSLEFVSGYRYSRDLYFDLAYEFVWKGKNTHQVTPSVHYNLASWWPKTNSLWVNWDLILAHGVGSNLGVEWKPYEAENPTFWQRLSYFADAHLYNGLSLYGERNITSLSPTSVLGFSAYAGVRLNY